MGVANIKIEKLYIEIPIKEFPVKSDLITGYKFPILVIQDDECSWNERHCKEKNDCFVWDLNDIYAVEGRENWFDELEDFCKKYKGTLIAEYKDEDPLELITYIRIRNGKKKKIKMIETDE